MSKDLKILLQSAIGTSRHIIATIVDIRGFTSFSQTVESLDVANFLKRVYLRIMEEYFQFACYFKPTGDGLLIITEYNPNNLREMANKVIEASLKLLIDFPKLCADDPMVNFQTPDKIGIGISRGAACCIASESEVVDYSGKAINLASRLTNVARPSGIVFDAGFNKNLLSADNLKPFSEDSIFNTRGIAENTAIKIYFTNQYTIISSTLKKPAKEPAWVRKIEKHSYGELKKEAATGTKDLSIDLKELPCDPDQINIVISFETGYSKEFSRRFVLDTKTEGVNYQKIGTRSFVDISFTALIHNLNKSKLADATIIEFEVNYPVERS